MGNRKAGPPPSVKRNLFLAILLLAPLSVAASGPDVTLSWRLPADYADGTPIVPENTVKIIVNVYSGPGRNGPWSWVATTLPGATSATVPGPPPGETLWYAVKSKLEGAESDYSVPVRKTNFSVPIPPVAKKIGKKMWAMRKRIFLVSLAFLVLLAGVAGIVRHRRRKDRMMR
jgi:hypothetical protein